MIGAFIVRMPDILQFIGLITVMIAIGLGVWKTSGMINRFRNPKR